MRQQVTERILHAYFENTATHHEEQLIKEWLQLNGNEEIFYNHLAIWEASHLQFMPDDNKAAQQFKKFLNGDGEAFKNPHLNGQNSRTLDTNWKYKYTSIAAALALLVCATFYFSRDYFLYDVYATSYGMTQNILLADGSEITLNANSTLKVPKDLTKKSIREVWLKGEAFFAVAKRPDHVRFSVHTDNLNVEVLGTKFNVNNRRGNTEVVLNEGSIRLSSDTDKAEDPVIMKPGEYVVRMESDTTFRKKTVKPEKYNAWQSNKLIYENTPLRIVADKIEDYYGVKIKIQNKHMADRQLTGTLPNNDLGIVLKSLSVSHHLNIVRENNEIIFR